MDLVRVATFVSLLGLELEDRVLVELLEGEVEAFAIFVSSCFVAFGVLQFEVGTIVAG